MDPGDDFPTDVLVEILLLLPPSARRRCRLVCRRWRDAVGTRTTEMQSRPKVLVAVGESAYVLDDIPSEGGRKLWTGDMARRYRSSMDIVGTCNGLVCLCNRIGAITVVNPLTGAALAVPPLPPHTAGPCWHWQYSFAYHPVTGRYKVVHVPLFFFEKVWVFTLGDTSWRCAVDGTASPQSRLKEGAGIVSVDGATYWATEGAETKVMSIDLEDDHVMSIGSMPPMYTLHSWYLAEVHGRLGIVISDDAATTVWALEGARAGVERSWSRWYIVRMPLHPPQYLAQPHFAHGSECILTLEWLPWRDQKGSILYRQHRPSGDRSEAPRGTVEISEWNKGTAAARIETRCNTCRTFSYVETTEPLSVYECW